MYVKILKEAGHEEAMLGLSLNKNQPVSNMHIVSSKLALQDGGHNKFLESICVWIDINAPRYWWSQFDTYRVGVTKQSESTMHTVMKQPLTAANFVGGIDAASLRELNFLIETGDFSKLKSRLPEGFLQRRIICTNYKALRNIVKQRRTHRLFEWRQFCADVEARLINPEYLR